MICPPLSVQGAMNTPDFQRPDLPRLHSELSDELIERLRQVMANTAQVREELWGARAILSATIRQLQRTRCEKWVPSGALHHPAAWK